ncbi:NADPH:quinone reductase [Chitinophaga sp. CF118]|uniref:NADP-dependent oxidoreductase n=1 Tax=Chitinophaga sp. CF118 TaxID=1884367 RepID=UPI0008E3DD34|nr:NADP-dependent oxidoreductase [Chitinophaga sp. CF118]SFD22242.1 NADPH:quinone reductase [Chitinophaga sp. CF118]
MKAILIKEAGGVENLVITEVPIPQISKDEVLIQVKAISINPVDVKARANEGVLAWVTNGERPEILGWDVSGIVVAVGTNVTAFKKDDEVFGMINFMGSGRTYAEYVAAPASQIALKPSNVSHEEAAAATLAALTAWQSLVTRVKIKAGDKILIHAAAGGVGHFAVQIARYLGAYIIGTSSAVNKDFILSLGADEHIDYNAHRFEEVVSDVDFVFDALGGENFHRSLNVLKKGGTLITILAVNETDIDKAKAKGMEGFFHMVNSNGNDMNELAKLMQAGKIKAHVSKTFSFDEMGAAHLQVESGRTRGKVIVTI